MSTTKLRPLIIGEVLFDCFPDRQVLGGAPFNVAWNLRGLGLDPLVITAIGNDRLGDQVRQKMQSWNLDQAGLQVCAGHATGRVDIVVQAGQPSYQFWDDVAFDHIAPADSLLETQSIGLLYHGSLALRGPVSRQTIHRLRRSAKCPVFVDINIRQPHFHPDWVEWILTDADHVKLNDQELMQLVLGTEAIQPDVPPSTSATPPSWDSLRQWGLQLKSEYNIGQLWITAGDQGAAWIGSDQQYLQVAAPQVTDLLDTVGAGDALSAVIIAGLLQSQTPAESLKRAVQFAAKVCTLRGAICDNADFYRT